MNAPAHVRALLGEIEKLVTLILDTCDGNSDDLAAVHEGWRLADQLFMQPRKRGVHYDQRGQLEQMELAVNELVRRGAS